MSERWGKSPEEWLVDGDYPGHGQIDAGAEQTTVYAPVPQPREEKTDSHAAKLAL